MVNSEVGDLLGPEGVRERSGSMRLFEDRAMHADERFSMAMSLCRKAVLSAQGIHYLAYYADGVYDFGMDLLADIAFRIDRPPSSIESRRSDYERIGCQLSNAVKDLDETLQQVRTGALIRVMLHAPRGVICCDSIVPDEYVVGLTFDPSSLPTSGVALSELAGARRIDITIARLATELRRQLSLQPLNPGAWISPKPASDEASSGPLSHPFARRDVSPYIEGAEDDAVADLFREAVDPDDLHYVACCRDGEVTFSVDQLGHHQLGRFFTQITPEKRRSFYRDFCRQLPVIIGQLGRMVGSAIGGRLERLVLDVEQGAIYYYRLGIGEYLVGVTIDQDQVAKADDKMAQLALGYQVQLDEKGN